MSVRSIRRRQWWKEHRQRVIVSAIFLGLSLATVWWLLMQFQCFQTPGSCS